MEHQARKRFGQNFLHDENIIHRIINSISPQKNEHIVEIGPGLGALTRVLAQHLNQFDAIEIDRDLIEHLNSDPILKNKLTIYSKDVLKFDFYTLNKTPLRIVGNLPYNISTPLCFHLLTFTHLITDMTFMLQKEVVDRMTADVNSKDYGRLSVMIQYHCEAESLFDVPPHAFTPQPKVNSAIVRLTPHQTKPYSAKNEVYFSEIVKASFAHPRKTLRNNLKAYLNEEQLHAIGINPQARAETLSVSDYVNISNFGL